jgi:catechol 2,3-dioxygenase-like lactoylglutathione lyase family enzyme
MATSVQVTFDCADPDAVARFWAAALGYELQPPPPGHESWESFLESIGVPPAEWNSASAVVDPAGVGPRLYFQRVPEPKSVKNRVHLDLSVGGGRATPPDERQRRVDDEVRRLTALGAREVVRRSDERFGESHVVMADPEGNEFCLQ